MSNVHALISDPLPEQYPGAVISTSHISFEDSQKLTEAARHSNNILAREHGFVLIVPGCHELVEKVFDESKGRTVYAIVMWALCRGIRYVELDGDGPILDGFSRYEW